MRVMLRNIEEDVSTATQTEDYDAAGNRVMFNCLWNGNQSATGFYPGFSGLEERGFMSNLMAIVMPGRGPDSLYTDNISVREDKRSIVTQTEELDPVTAKGQQLSYLVIQDLALKNDSIPSWAKDDVYEALSKHVRMFLDANSILFNEIMNNMSRIINATSFRAFKLVANLLFGADKNGNQELMTVDPRKAWVMVISVFAFAVRAVLEYREDQDRVDEITRYLASYVSSHVVPFVRLNGGWAGLVESFTFPVDTVALVKRAIMWFCVCVVFLTACKYVSLLLR